MKVGNNPKDWGDFVCPQGNGDVVTGILKFIGKMLTKGK